MEKPQVLTTGFVQVVERRDYPSLDDFLAKGGRLVISGQDALHFNVQMLRRPWESKDIPGIVWAMGVHSALWHANNRWARRSGQDGLSSSHDKPWTMLDRVMMAESFNYFKMSLEFFMADNRQVACWLDLRNQAGSHRVTLIGYGAGAGYALEQTLGLLESVYVHNGISIWRLDRSTG